MAQVSITDLPSKTASGSQYLAVEDSESTGKQTVDNVVAAAAQVQANANGISSLSSRVTNKANVSLNSLTESGLYYCQSSCTDMPMTSPVSTWVVTVIANTGGTVVKQIARAAAGEGYEFERHLSGGAWTSWIDVGRMVPFSGDHSTAAIYHKPGNANYGSFLILGTVGGIGGVAIACTVSNGSLGSSINLLTGSAWSNTGLTIGYSVSAGVGYISLKTTSTANSSGVIIGG